MRGTEPTARGWEIPLREPHLGALKVKLRQRNRRDPTIARQTLLEEVLRSVEIAPLGVKRSQRRDRGEIGSTFLSLLYECACLVVASDGLEDGCPFAIHHAPIGSEARRFVEVF